MHKKIFVTTLLVCFISVTIAQTLDPLQMLQTMSQKAKEVKTIRYNAVMNERIDDGMVVKNSFFKINVLPRKIYVAQSFIGIKLDGLYCEGWNKNQLLVATVGFPWLQLSLDPLGSRVRDNHHHTIFEAGFNYFVEVVDEFIKNRKDEIIITNAGKIIAYDRNCYKVNIEIKNFKIINYKVQQGENLTTIAKKLFINDYKILALNPEIDDYTDVVPGQIISIPNAYAKSMSLYIDLENMLPVQIDINDEKGLYGSYGYKKLVINVPFDHDEFSAMYKGYHFR
jgi:outer membrane lipoprotein-sorting protein